MSEILEDRRENHFSAIMETRERLTKLETQRESDHDFYERHLSTMSQLVEEMKEVKLSINTIQTQKNTVLGVAAVLGSAVTLIGKALFSLMTSQAK